MKFIRYQTASVSLICWLLASLSSLAVIDEATLDELLGASENLERKASELGVLYEEAIAHLMPKIASKLEGVRGLATANLRQLGLNAARPGAEANASAFCAAAAKALGDAATPELGRQLLIEGLGFAGSASSVPALVQLAKKEHPVEQDAARMALQSIPGDEAEKALVELLEAEGSLRLGAIDSLGARGEEGAVAALTPLLGAKEPEVAAAAATALGRIGGAEATRALGSARAQASDKKAQGYLEYALLDIASQRLRARDPDGAGKIFQVLGEQTQHLAVRSAAVIGVARAVPQTADEIVIAAVRSADPRLRSAGISAALSVPSARLAKGLAAMLPTQPKHIQIQLLEVLAAKRAVAVQEQVVAFLASTEDEDLQEVAIRALGPLGSINVLELLLAQATSDSSRNRRAAMSSLAELKGTDVANAIEFHAREGKTSEIRAVAVGLFMRNRARTGLKRMIAFAGETDAQVRGASLSVLRKEAGDPELRELLILMNTGSVAIVPVVKAVCGRTKDVNYATNEVVSALGEAEKDSTKRHLIDCLRVLGTGRGLSAVEEQIADGSRTRDAALKAISKWPNGLALPIMLEKLKEPKAESATTRMMVHGISRLLTGEAEIPQKDRQRYAYAAFDAATRASEQQMLLPAIAQLPSGESADIIHRMLGDRYVKVHAAYAGATLAEKLVEIDPEEAKGLANAIVKGPFNANVKARARSVLKKLGA